MNKTESALVRKEIRALKSALTNRQKQTAREIKKRRDLIRSTEKEISAIERETNSLLPTPQRLSHQWAPPPI